MSDIATPAAAPAAPAPTPAAKAPAPAAAKAPAAEPVRKSPAEFRTSLQQGDYDLNDSDFETPETTESVTSNIPDIEASEEDTHSPEDFEEAAPEEEEIDETDYSWIKEYSELHGVPVKDLLAALQQGLLPDALMDKIKIKMKDGSDEWEGTILDAKNSAQMRKNYTRKLMEHGEAKKAFEAEKNGFNSEREAFVGLLKGWKGDGKALLSGLRAMEFPVLEMAQALAQELQELEEMGPAARGLYEAKQKAEQQAELNRLELEKARREHQMYLDSQKSKTEEVSNDQVISGVREFAPSVFKEMNLAITEGTWNIFTEQLGAMWREHGTPNKEMVRFAIQATKEIVDQHLAKHTAAPAAPAAKPAQKVSIPRLDGGKPAATNRPGSKAGPLTPAQFRAKIIAEG